MSRTRIRPCSTSGMTWRISPAVARQPTSSSSSRTRRCMGISTPLVGMPTAAHLPPLRSIPSASWTVAGTPAHSSTTSTPCPSVAALTSATGSGPPLSTVSKPNAAALASRTLLFSTTITRLAPRTSAASPASSPIAPAPVGDLQGDRGGIYHRSLGVREAVGQVEDRLHTVDHVGRVRPRDVVAVLLVEAQDAVVLAEVVVTLDALLADAAGVVRGAGHTVADLPAVGRGSRPHGHDVAGPLVAGYEGEGWRPEARVVTADQMGVGATDRNRPHPGQDLVGSRHRNRHLLDLEVVGLEHDEGLHGGGNVEPCRGPSCVGGRKGHHQPPLGIRSA